QSLPQPRASPPPAPIGHSSPEGGPKGRASWCRPAWPGWGRAPHAPGGPGRNHSWPLSCSDSLHRNLPARVVGRLACHLDVVRMAFPQPGGGDADEPPIALDLADARCTGVAHCRPQPSDELVGDGGERAAVGHLTLDALRHQLVVGEEVVLRIAVPGVRSPAAARLHRADRPHSAVGLELLAVDEQQLARRLLAAGEQRSHHDSVGPGDDGLRDVAGILQPAVTDHRYPGGSGARSRLGDCCDLRDADAGHPAGCTDRTRRARPDEPGPAAPFMPSPPASINAWAPSLVATFPPTTWTEPPDVRRAT